MATTTENKEKGHVSGDEVVHIEALKPILPISSEKRKTVSKTLDTRNLPSNQGNKKPKLESFTPSKSFVVKTNPFIPLATSNQPLTPPKANTPLPNASPSLNPFTAASPKSHPLNLLRSEGLAQDRFQHVDNDVNICYDMSVKEFKRSTIHDLFKVFSFIHSHL